MKSNNSDHFASIWEYIVKQDAVEEFRKVYGSEGDWVRLFRRSSGYIRTELYQDVNNPHRFVTTDLWISKVHRDTFRTECAEEFELLDKECASLTETEQFLGDFLVQTPHTPDHI